MLDKYKDNEFIIELNQNHSDKDVYVCLILNNLCVGWVNNESNGKWNVVFSHYPRTREDISNRDCTVFGLCDTKEMAVEGLWQERFAAHVM